MSTKKKRKERKAASLFLVCHKAADRADACCAGRFGYYYFGGYADQIQQMRREAVQEVSASDDSTFIPSQTCSVLIKTEN